MLISNLKKFNFLTCCLLTLITGCTNFMSMQQLKLKRIRFGCSRQCQSIVGYQYRHALNAKQKSQIRKFLKRKSRRTDIMVSECDPNHSHHLTSLVARYIASKGYRPVMVKATFPYHHLHGHCVNLVRGPIILYPPKCSKSVVNMSNPSYNPLV